jgi:amidohydrolase
MQDDDIINLRHELHRNPELSNKEYKTSARITEFMLGCFPDEVIELNNTGKAFIFNGTEKGKSLMFRAELDALPILESSSVSYPSAKPSVSHACGHDGHMAILAGLAKKIAENQPQKGRVILLFQPAEEVEQGAKDVVEDPRFKKIEPDYIFALHNIPGEEKNKILLNTGTFSAASRGMTIKLFGHSSHAAEPENGLSPANAIARLIVRLHELAENKLHFKDFALLTIIHIRLGEVSFGTSPGYAEMMITLRAFDNGDMHLLTVKSEEIISEIALSEKLKHEVSYSEVFPALINDPECTRMAELAAREHNLQVEYREIPYKWSEDFAYYTEKYSGCFLGLGAGVDQPQLHNPDYDFPDDIISGGINLFFAIYKKINLKDE